MTTIGYTLTVHHDDGTTRTVKVTLEEAAVLASQVGGGRQSKYTYLNSDTCPVHGPWKAVQAGVSKNTGKAYDAFWTCDTDRDEPRCSNKPSKEWVETHPPHMGGQPVQAAPEPPAGTPSSAGEYDDLPF